MEYVAKPAVMIVLFILLWNSAASRATLVWFGFGIIFSLLGDVLLMISLDRLFLAGLIAFLLAHVAYVIGFNIPFPAFSTWGVTFTVIVALGGWRIIGRIISALSVQRQTRLQIPIVIYSVVIGAVCFVVDSVR